MSTEHSRPAATDLRTPMTARGEVLRDLVVRHLPQIRAGAEDNGHRGVFPTETFEAFGKDGLMGATAPAELGGLGVDCMHDVALALAAVAEADASTALAWHVQLSRGLTFGWEWRHGAPPVRALAEHLLREMAAGQAAVCSAVKDHHAAVTTLERDEAGRWWLTGRKTLVSMAPIGTHFVVHAQAQLEGEPATLPVVLLPRDAPGLRVLDDWEGLGMCASGTADVAFDRCPVDAANVVSRRPVGGHDDAVLAGQTVSSITMLGIYTGIAQAARDIAAARFARGSGRPPAAAATLLAEIDARLYALRATVTAALRDADAAAADLTGDPAERGRRMMTPFQYAKMTVNRLSLDIVNDSLTVVGGASYSAAHPLSRLVRDVRAGWFMQPYTYVDGVSYLSGQALRLDRDNDYVSARAVTGVPGGAPDASEAGPR
ncbi:acyl-CoA dehydrogenase family protein [Amycolatopsis saalfeldensis]|uniref:Dibenzothiophene monooxygenase n=1 Tax=Amycolatopsis saalfeldensis TaxID=394193 RepID=A0A1H8YJN5_9PSEU|nr:acyl-CoA dehydrogenase family protein [Amycolatopsis saalfeldensis]SEP52380.1 Acyl-CoA dehydrogenase [Amycolatopsis saalfeldensis]